MTFFTPKKGQICIFFDCKRVDVMCVHTKCSVFHQQNLIQHSLSQLWHICRTWKWTFWSQVNNLESILTHKCNHSSFTQQLRSLNFIQFLIYNPAWLKYSLHFSSSLKYPWHFSVTKSQRQLLLEWVFGIEGCWSADPPGTYGTQTYLQKTAKVNVVTCAFTQNSLGWDVRSHLLLRWRICSTAHTYSTLATLFLGLFLLQKASCTTNDRLKGERGHWALLFHNPFINKVGQKTTLFPRMGYTSCSLMLLSGRNWLGWALTINVEEFYCIVQPLYGGPRGWGNRRGAASVQTSEVKHVKENHQGGSITAK